MGKKTQLVNEEGSSSNDEGILGRNDGTNSTSAPSGTSLSTRSTTHRTPKKSKPSSSNHAYEFVLVTDSNSRRQVRRHAMRQYMRQKRADGIARLGPSHIPVPNWSTRASDSAQKSSSSVSELCNDPDIEKCAPISSSGHGQRLSNTGVDALSSVGTVSNYSKHGSMLIPRSRQRSLAPVICPSAGSKKDPFNSFPLSLSDNDQMLINHYIVTYPSMMYKMAGTYKKNPIQEIFQSIAMKDKLGFQAMLAIAAKHRAGVEGRKESVQSLTHKMKALSLVNESIGTEEKGISDGMIYAVASLAVIEKWDKDPSIERTHFLGLASMIKKRGGMRGLRASSKLVEQLLYWVDFSCAPKAIFGASMPWTGSIQDTLPKKLQFLSPDLHLTFSYRHVYDNSKCEADILRACEDFLTFFRCLHLAEKALLYRSHLGTQRTRTSTRKIVFNPSTTLYSVLTKLPDYDHGIRDVRFIDEYSSLACLLYLNIALYDYYVEGRNFDDYVGWLDEEIYRGGFGPDSPPSVSAVMWWFLGNGGYPLGEDNDDGERNWFVSRMLRVAKRLEWNQKGVIWDKLRAILIRFILTQQDCGLGSDDADGVGKSEWFARERATLDRTGLMWDEDEMRKEILGELYMGPPIYTTAIISKTEGPPTFLRHGVHPG